VFLLVWGKKHLLFKWHYQDKPQIGKIFANHRSYKCVCTIYKELLQFSSTMTNNSITKWAKNRIDVSPKKIYK
jgi:hypothetical protein